ncbi:neuroendocrine protein 7B2 [Eurytemora carolleeae]|uniref:neuroendocrine protein 7B2 n=1 Tax=Eurytemora carolleeae TaxID=1294199 RepID=UPI000C786ABB|nr:neuroendocrine protein 7B2 [Eurytemora carolleeae]|eukprot:XP_023326710.1 neuroendocrine protein 7B2-like [Eurytemora affinis]
MLIFCLIPLVSGSFADYNQGLSGNLINDMLNDNDYYDVEGNTVDEMGPVYGHTVTNKIEPKPETRRKSSLLPAYCDPPNPCPLGYTAQDGCIEEFENKAEFSRHYQASQTCMCDSEHMFSCPQQEMDLYGMSKRQSDGIDLPKNPFEEEEESLNPFLTGPKLPIAAKKGMVY